MPYFPKIGTLGAQDANNVNVSGGAMSGVTLDGGTSANPVSQRYAMPRVTTTALNTAASSNVLIVGQPYYLTDTDRIAVALTVSTYQEFKSSVVDLISTTTLNGASSYAVTNIPNYRMIFGVFDDTTFSNTGTTGASYLQISHNNSTYTNNTSISASVAHTDLVNGGFIIVQNNGAGFIATFGGITGATKTPLNFSPFKLTARINAIKIVAGAGNFDGGTLVLYGIF